MLKLVTQPRSRRKRDWWRATPGRRGGCSVPPPPAGGFAERTGGCVPRVLWSAGAGWRSRASQNNRAGRRPLCFTSARTERRTEQRTAVRERPLVVGGRSVSPAQGRSGDPPQPRRSRACAALALDRAQRCRGRRVADDATPACGNRGCRHIPTVLRGEQVHLRLSRSLTACETARCRRRSTAGRKQGAETWSAPEPASHDPGCSPPPRSAPLWTECPTTAACRRETRDDEEAGGSKPPWSARGCAGADVGQVPNAPLLHRRGPSTRSAVTLPSPDIP